MWKYYCWDANVSEIVFPPPSASFLIYNIYIYLYIDIYEHEDDVIADM